MENNLEHKAVKNEKSKNDTIYKANKVKLWTIGTIATLAVATWSFYFLHDKLNSKPVKPVYETIRLGVSDEALVRDNNFVLNVQYNGMVNDKVFSVSNGRSNNQYYPSSSKKIYFYGSNIDVLKVIPDSLVLSYKSK